MPKPLAGMTFVFPGELSGLARPAAAALVRRLGGRASSGVSRKTAYVVAGASPGSKLDTAKRRGVKIVEETEFLRMVRT